MQDIDSVTSRARKRSLFAMFLRSAILSLTVFLVTLFLTLRICLASKTCKIRQFIWHSQWRLVVQLNHISIIPKPIQFTYNVPFDEPHTTLIQGVLARISLPV